MKNENITKYRDEFVAVGLKIGYLRRQRGMTQGFLSQIEAPNLSVGLSLATLLSIAEALQVPPSKLLEFD